MLWTFYLIYEKLESFQELYTRKIEDKTTCQYSKIIRYASVCSWSTHHQVQVQKDQYHDLINEICFANQRMEKWKIDGYYPLDRC